MKLTQLSRAAVVIAATAAATAARAEAGTDFSSITAAVAFGGVVTAVLGIAAVLTVPLVAKKGARMVLSMIGR